MLRQPDDIRQLYEYDCGPTCVQSITGVRPRIGSKNGTTTRAIRGWLMRQGHPCTFGTYLTLRDLKHFVDTGRYAISLITNECGLGHWIVVYRVSNRNVYVHDPAKGRVKIPLSKFQGMWQNDGYEQLAIFVTVVGED